MGRHKKAEKMTPTTQFCSSPLCFFCIMKEDDPTLRKANISTFFENIDDIQDKVVAISVLWNLAMARPDDPELPSLGIFECMANLITKGVNDKEWLLSDQNIYIPYYASHIIGSYTMNRVEFAERAVQSGIIPSLMELMRGKMCWVEQRVAVRALGHLASYETTFLALEEYEEELVSLAMHISSTCLEVVYNKFVAISDRRKRPRYQSDLLTRGVGGMEIENRKAEEWASQLQCWSLYLLNCFAYKGKSLHLICNPNFVQNLCNMWGGMVNDASPAGYGLLRILCYNKYGRKSIAGLRDVVEALGNLSRSSDDWQYIGVDCLLLLLKDEDTRNKVIDLALGFLVDLMELKTLGGRSNVGQTIINTLLLDSRKGRKSSKFRNYNHVQRGMEEVKVLLEMKKRDKAMSEEKLDEMRVLVDLAKDQGNKHFWSGNVEEAINKYSEGLELCPLKLKRERIVLLSNRAQCHLLLRNPDAVIKDTTRALCLTTPPNSHRKSLWRRSQAYDMKGLAKESLMDCIMFLNCCIKSSSSNYLRIPYHATRMISKQMEATWLFNRSSALQMSRVGELNDSEDDEIIGTMSREDKGFESNKFHHQGSSSASQEIRVARGGSEGRRERNKKKSKSTIAWTT